MTDSTRPAGIEQMRTALEKIAALKPFAVQTHHLPLRGLGNTMVCSPEAVQIARAALTDHTTAPVGDEVERLREELTWYADKVAGCRKYGPDGDRARAALDLDGGNRALAALNHTTKGAE